MRRTPRRRRALIPRGRKRRRRLLAAAALLLLAFGASQTFAASNTVRATYAGAGTQAVTTPTYSNVELLPNRDNPQLIRQVTLTTSAAAATYTISTGGAFTSCANASGAVTCTAIAGAAPPESPCWWRFKRRTPPRTPSQARFAPARARLP